MARSASRPRVVWVTTRLHEFLGAGRVPVTMDGCTRPVHDISGILHGRTGAVLAYVPEADSRVLNECSHALELKLVDPRSAPQADTIQPVAREQIASRLREGDAILCPITNPDGTIASFYACYASR